MLANVSSLECRLRVPGPGVTSRDTFLQVMLTIRINVYAFLFTRLRFFVPFPLFLFTGSAEFNELSARILVNIEASPAHMRFRFYPERFTFLVTPLEYVFGCNYRVPSTVSREFGSLWAPSRKCN